MRTKWLWTLGVVVVLVAAVVAGGPKESSGERVAGGAPANCDTPGTYESYCPNQSPNTCALKYTRCKTAGSGKQNTITCTDAQGSAVCGNNQCVAQNNADTSSTCTKNTPP